MGVGVGGSGVSVGGIGVSVGGTGVSVGGTSVGVSVGGTGVSVGGTGVSVGGMGVSVGGIGVPVGKGVSEGTGVIVCTKAIAPCKLVTSSAAKVDISAAGTTMNSSQAKSIETTTSRTFAPRLRLPNQLATPPNESPSSEVRSLDGFAREGRAEGLGFGARRGLGFGARRGLGSGTATAAVASVVAATSGFEVAG